MFKYIDKILELIVINMMFNYFDLLETYFRKTQNFLKHVKVLYSHFLDIVFDFQKGEGSKMNQNQSA